MPGRVRIGKTGKIATRAWTAAMTLLFILTAFAPSQQDPSRRLLRPRNIILIGWDGAQRDHVKECLSRGELPNLAALASAGRIAAIDILRTTDTASGWAQILTGYNPEKTGVYSNSRYQTIPAGYTIIERLENHFGPGAIATAAILAKAGTLEAAPGKPLFNAGLAADAFIGGLGENDEVGKAALRQIDLFKDVPFFIFIHFSDPDFRGHSYGENSAEYNSALVSSDAWLGRIMEKLSALGIHDQTLVYVAVDHGFDEGLNTHNDAPYVFLATNDPSIARPGDRADIAPTILYRFGVDLKKIVPPLDGYPLYWTLIPPIW